MGNNINEAREYIDKNFTPQDKERAVEYYQTMTGADAETARREVERLYEQRRLEGRELPMPKEWTPTGQQHELGKRLLFVGRLLLIFAIIVVIGGSFLICHEIRKTVNAVSDKEREEWLAEGYEVYRTQGGVVEIIDYKFVDSRMEQENYGSFFGGRWGYLYLFRPEENEELYFGVFSEQAWYNYDDFYSRGLEFFYWDSGVTEEVEMKNCKIQEAIIVSVEDVAAGHGIMSENAVMVQIVAVVMFGFFGVLMGAGAIVMMVSGKKKIKNNPM